MTQEQKQEKKKPGLIKKIFKWIGLSILTLLILLALFYEAPKKLVILLLIILAAFTALPKPARKWFWLGVGAVVLVLIVWLFMPEDKESWRPYTFDKELAALEAKYAIPDEENAGLVYDEISKTLDTDSNQPDFFLTTKPSSKDGPWLSKDHPETTEWLKGYQNIIAKLIQAAHKDKCHFPIPADSWDIGQHMERLAPMRQCAFLVVSSANNDMAEGRIDEGLEKYLCIIRMADHLYQQPIEIDFLVASALKGLALTQLNRFVIESESTAEQLQIISNASGGLKNIWDSQFKRFLESNKLLTKNTICSMAYEVNSEGKVRLSRNPIASVNATQPQELPTLTRVFYKSKTIFNWFFMPSTPQKAAEILDARFKKHYAMTKPDFDRNTQPDQQQPRFKLNYGYIVELMTSLTYPVYYRIHETYQKHLTFRRGSRLLIAIKQYYIENNTWPPDLDAIKSAAPAEAFIDPVTGNPLQYENHGERFSLYGETANIWPK